MSNVKPLGVTILVIAGLLVLVRHMADDGCRSVGGDTYRRSAGEDATDLVGGAFDASEDAQVGNRAVERALVPEIVFGTPEAAVTGHHRPGQAVVPHHCRAGVVRGRTLAPDFVEARYDSSVARVFSAVIAIVISMIYCVAQYKGIGLVFAWMLGIDYTQALVFGIVVTMF